MSVRIYQLSKELGITNKELILLLQQRGLDVSSPSNTIPNIYADSLTQELEGKAAEPSGSLQETPAAPQPVAAVIDQPAPTSTVLEPTKLTFKEEQADKTKLMLPEGRFVKSASEVAQDKRTAAGKEVLQQRAPLPAPTGTALRPMAPPVVAAAPKLPVFSGSAPQLPTRSLTPPSPLESRPEKPLVTPAAVVFANEVSAPTLPRIESKAAQKSSFEDLKILPIKPPIILRELANLIQVKPFRVISELMEMGIFASMNQVLEEDIASKVAQRYGYLIEVEQRKEVTEASQQPKKKAPEPQPEIQLPLEPRPPVVCVLGHVDHGKTTLLDVIRKANVAAGEAGGITQHIGAYQVEHKGHKITFLDTPGHAAFSKMRERGANSTDIAILVVAADDGFMPQTDEALKFAQKAHLAIVVAINKADAKGANIDRVKQQLQQRGIAPEEWGGETLCTPISALKGEKIDELLDLVLLQAEMLELKAPVQGPAEGIVIESQIEIGRGSTATVIVQRGTLRVGDALVCGQHYCKVRALMDEKGKNLKEALPSTPVRIIGWTTTPEAGGILVACKTEKEARQKAEENSFSPQQPIVSKTEVQRNVTVEDLFAAIANTKEKCFKIIIKADVHGSLEALVGCLESIASTKVKLEILDAQVGSIGKNDIALASTAGAVIVGFNVKMEAGAQPLAKHHKVSIIQHPIIYELVEQVKLGMSELLDPELRENKLGSAQVRQVFPLAKAFVAGCMVTEGRLIRDSSARLIRAKKVIHEGTLDTLKRFKEDATEVKSGYECGVILRGWSNYQTGDIIECFEVVKIPSSL